MLFLYELVVLSLTEREKKTETIYDNIQCVSNCGFLFTNLQIHIFLNIFFFLLLFYLRAKKTIDLLGRNKSS